MVTFIPPYMGEEIKSNAERKMYDVLQQLDMKNAYILHSLGLPKHQSKIYGEVDFVVVCDRGVACLEIKGGRIECREGRWYFTDRYGVEREKSEGPFAQVIGNMFSLRDALKNRFKGNQHMKNLLSACGVVFPDIEFKSDSQESIPEIVFDTGIKDISKYINDVFDYWQKRQHRESGKLPPSTIKEIVDYLRGDFIFIPSLKDRLDNIERRLIRLTAEQAQVMEALALNKHLLIEGNAGTGKTLLAVDFALKQAQKGQNVLYLTFNKNLAYDVRNQIGNNRNLKVINIHALFGEYVDVDVSLMQENPQTYFSEILPEDFFNYITGLGEDEAEKLKFDLVVMDEGQDILTPIYLYCLDVLLRGGLDKGNWAVFYDEKQNIYNPDYKEGMDLLLSYQNAVFKLYINCRNTVQIGTYTSQVSGVALADFIREQGEEVERVSYTDNADFKIQIKDILKFLRNEKLDIRDVVFLSPKRYRNSLLAETGINANELKDNFDTSLDMPVFATIQGFKGLDAKVVILIDVEDIKRSKFSQYFYIAGTRARTLLYVVGNEKFWSEH